MEFSTQLSLCGKHKEVALQIINPCHDLFLTFDFSSNTRTTEYIKYSSQEVSLCCFFFCLQLKV